MIRKAWICAILFLSAVIRMHGNEIMKDTLIQNKMIIEVWSDIACPFCYIGKSRLEKALNKFEHKDDVQIVWRSFQLNPYLQTDTTISLYESLAQQKGWTNDYTRQVSAQVSNMAKADGLDINFDKVVVANTYKAHLLLQIAGKRGVQAQVGDALFKAYFVEGKNIDDVSVLQSIAVQSGMDAQEVLTLLSEQRFKDMVEQDIKKAESLRVTGVPFFFFINEYPISGAQDESVFLNALNKGWSIHAKTKPFTKQVKMSGEVCAPKGNCE